ncbi:MAG: tRNA (adenosine(37)-N6)-threonylcarbamoyltransferase complex dimerization subunit type 1 TsaB [Oligosphaeraceae bacterium]|nr:tRNA (adenosine(37)-N6)-threonylcarbamoyltransferase complex dimerization subunit type 1 TsaB [Oligosphaeraceae bacterium]
MIYAALDCSFGCSLAVKNKERILFSEHLPLLGRESDRQMSVWLQQSLADLNIDVKQIGGWTLGLGPGSFAGLRCGIALVKALCLASKATMRGLPSSYALAANCPALPCGTNLGVLHDGRMGQVILSPYRIDATKLPIPLSEPKAFFPEELLSPENSCQAWTALTKQQLPKLPGEIEGNLQWQSHVSASLLLQAPEQLYPWPVTTEEQTAAVEPVYVRQAVFVKPAKLRQQTVDSQDIQDE